MVATSEMVWYPERPGEGNRPVIRLLWIAAAVGLLLPGPGPVRAEDPAGFRGPGRNGIYPARGLLDSWDPTPPKLLWQRSGIGQGWLAPTIADGRVYVLGSQGGTGRLSCYRLDGSKVYRVEFGPAFDRRYPGCRSTVEVVDGRVYFASGQGVIYCLDAATGRTVWQVDTVETFGNRPSNYGYNCTPLVADGKVVFSMTDARAQTVALDASTGRTLWAADPADWTVSDASPILVRLAERSLVVETFHEATVGRDLADGKVLWQHRPGGHTQLTPVHADGKLLVRSGNGTALLDLAADGTGVRTLWTGPRIHDVSQAVILARTVFVITQPIRRQAVVRAVSEGQSLELAGRKRLWFLQAWDLATGTVCRARRVYSGGALWAADGRVYVLEGGQGPGPDGRQGRTRIRLVQPTAEGFAPRGLLYPVRGRRQAWANGAIAEGKMAYRHGDVLGLYGLRPGRADPKPDPDDPGPEQRPVTDTRRALD